MRLFSILILSLAAALAGCAEEHHAARVPPQNFVPSTAIVQASYRNDRPLPSQVLPASDANYDIPRYDRFAYATYSEYAYIYTYDWQDIGIRNSGGSGYRYRFIYRTLP